MVRLDAKKQDGHILITEDCFEHLLNCLDNQKFIDYETSENQPYIDDFNKQCRRFWLSEESVGLFKEKAERKEVEMKIQRQSIPWLEI